MSTVGAYDAKTHLPQLLNRVAKGERITITKHGVPVAVLQSPRQSQKIPPQEVIANIRAFREQLSLKGISIREMIDDGRK